MRHGWCIAKLAMIWFKNLISPWYGWCIAKLFRSLVMWWVAPLSSNQAFDGFCDPRAILGRGYHGGNGVSNKLFCGPECWYWSWENLLALWPNTPHNWHYCYSRIDWCAVDVLLWNGRWRDVATWADVGVTLETDKDAASSLASLLRSFSWTSDPLVL